MIMLKRLNSHIEGRHPYWILTVGERTWFARSLLKLTYRWATTR